MTLSNTLTNNKRHKDSTDEEQSPSEQDDDSGDNYGVKSKAKRHATSASRNKRSKPVRSSSATLNNKPRREKYSKKDGFIVDDESDGEETDPSDDSLPAKSRTSSRRKTGSFATSSTSKATTRKSQSSGQFDNGEDDVDDDDDLSGDDGQGLDTSVIINSSRRTRGKKVDYSQFNRLANDDDETGDHGADNNDIEDDVISDSGSESDGGNSSISD